MKAQITKVNGIDIDLFFKMFHVEHFKACQQLVHRFLRDKLWIGDLNIDKIIETLHNKDISQENRVRIKKISERYKEIAEYSLKLSLIG